MAPPLDRDRPSGFVVARRWAPLAALALTLILAGCERRAEVAPQASNISQTPPAPSPRRPLRVAIGATITPREGFIFYGELIDYIEARLGRKVELTDSRTYAEVNGMLRRGEVDFAFVCGGPYVTGHRDFGLQMVATPVVSGKTTYESIILVRGDSDLRRVTDLRGKRFAWVDPHSNSGYTVPYMLFVDMGEEPGSFFRKAVFTFGHDVSIMAVASGAVDGAAVSSVLYDYYRGKLPEVASKVREIWRSQPYGTQPVVVRPGLDAATKTALTSILLHAHDDPKAQRFLSGMGIERFDAGDDGNYDGIRRLQARLAAEATRTR